MKRKAFNRKCIICGKEFYRKPYYLRKGWGKYCSIECKNASQRNGKFVECGFCGKKIYRGKKALTRLSVTNKYFCSLSCHCAWKNKQRKNKKRIKWLKNLWRPWCNSSIRTCGVLGADANSVGLPPKFFFIFQRSKKKKIESSVLKRPSKKDLYNLYWNKNYTQSEIAKIFNATHTSVKRWLNYYRISVKVRSQSCGQNPSSLKNLELGSTEEAKRKSAEARRIYSKEKLIKIIREFVEEEGRIPTKNEFAKNPLYPDYVTYRDYFGTWNNAIKAAGFEPNKKWFFSKKLYAKDGHLCYSFSEIIIDDWFFKNNIFHEREILYPEGKYRCDFVVNNIFIEFFGLVNASNVSLKYNEIIQKKREMCKKHHIRLIELYENDIYNLDETLEKKLKLKSRQKVSI